MLESANEQLSIYYVVEVTDCFGSERAIYAGAASPEGRTKLTKIDRPGKVAAFKSCRAEGPEGERDTARGNEDVDGKVETVDEMNKSVGKDAGNPNWEAKVSDDSSGMCDFLRLAGGYRQGYDKIHGRSRPGFFC